MKEEEQALRHPWPIRLIFLFSMTVLALGGLGAQNNGAPLIKATIGFAGWVVPGRWMPLIVDLDRPQPGAILELRRSRDATAVATVEQFVMGQSLHLEIPVFIDENSRQFSLRLLSGNQVLAQRTLPALSQIYTGHLVLADGLSLAERTALSHLLFPREPLQVVSRPARLLPPSVLSLDSVSMIVLRNPGQSLGPQQLLALRAWLAGGGHLVILDDANGVWARNLVAGQNLVPDLGEGLARYRYGLGELSACWLPQGQTIKMTDIPDWQQLVDLAPFDQSPRLSVGMGFPRNFDRPSGLAVPLISQVPAVFQIAIWLVLMLAACFFRRHLFKILVPLTLLGLVVGAIWWSGPEAAWQKGTIIHQRAIVLPQGAGFLVSGNLWFPEFQANRMPGIDRSPWGINLDWRDAGDGGRVVEGGRLQGMGSTSAPWIHQSSQARLLLRSASVAAWQLNGFLPAPSSGSGLIAQYRVRYEAGQIRFSAAGNHQDQWKDIELSPAAYTADLAWIGQLCRLFPDRLWTCGMGGLPANGLHLDGVPATSLTWIAMVEEAGS